MLKARQDDLLAGLRDLAGEEDFVEDGIDLVQGKVKDAVSCLAFGE